MAKTYRISGMTCGGCVSSVSKALARVVAAESIEVSLEHGTVTIDGEHNEAAVKAAVDGAGFEFGGAVSE